jgi:hypothetical protein
MICVLCCLLGLHRGDADANCMRACSWFTVSKHVQAADAAAAKKSAAEKARYEAFVRQYQAHMAQAKVQGGLGSGVKDDGVAAAKQEELAVKQEEGVAMLASGVAAKRPRPEEEGVDILAGGIPAPEEQPHAGAPCIARTRQALRSRPAT